MVTWWPWNDIGWKCHFIAHLPPPYQNENAVTKRGWAITQTRVVTNSPLDACQFLSSPPSQLQVKILPQAPLECWQHNDNKFIQVYLNCLLLLYIEVYILNNVHHFLCLVNILNVDWNIQLVCGQTWSSSTTLTARWCIMYTTLPHTHTLEDQPRDKMLHFIWLLQLFSYF